MFDMKNLTKLKKLDEKAPGPMKAFWAFDKEAFSAGALDILQKQLMAVAVALTTQCPYCIELFKSESHSIHQLVAGGARGIGSVFRHPVPIGLGLGLGYRRQIRVHAWRRIRHMQNRANVMEKLKHGMSARSNIGVRIKRPLKISARDHMQFARRNVVRA